ncbi:MAG TPA: Asp-tRNA(Asn)/Glu-tRNA(Gln) amidotransferase subunit GatB [Phycisphaerae bacterium]|nr:Asp-tRNA(Asn)/Glu-tRNA(Gln) amidotransferase subunit GatB [Phycisphaerae bacterium]HOJ55826.1 Asp-tRNA(Asn)/Glu-tRNA(Gln) amidotransferase subunit GatB [Phycisphaerae bacterium]HOL25806.1 Asp-tRNA(Asn)/Glu-tRNA(Gln) amidotransferase subunit GatB [Phycisphaerae bacterium]HPP21320.1 Asp-tRNA(Asn)/Glu-tRNA(Gln) amidotransferase subunit GatB [Phycisphaerae bacterium]HPU32040.1 Asp-tRNA(Asn)/Glu-tRNA(Gln) amidotransferase subunit GatB [Phycisphaerae bacterium]
MEIHVQLATKTKLFCACPIEFGAPPNSRVCPVCLGMPGVLPVLNRTAYEHAVRTAIALKCEIARFTKWDRKSYYYPDLPKNYQISQYDLPLGFDGAFDVPVDDAAVSNAPADGAPADGEPEGGRPTDGGSASGRPESGVAAGLRTGRSPRKTSGTESTGYRRVGIIRAHLEEDAGKNLHEKPGITQVDLNRTGTPLLEIVTEPDLASADEAYNFCVELQRLVTYLGASEASMQKGQMRFEPNVNVAIEYDGREYRTPIAEVKNLNSFKAVRDAIRYEIERQVSEWMADPDYVINKRPKENRGWDDVRGVTEFQRGKEEAHDYRYFPDPDLVPVEVDDAWIESMKDSVGELPLERQARMSSEYGLSSADAATILADRATADLFEEAAEAGHPPTLGKQFISFWSAHANARNTTIAGLGIDAARLGELSKITADGLVNATAAAIIAEKMLSSSDTPTAIAQREGLIQTRDEGQVQAWVEEAFTKNEKAVQDALANPKKQQQARGFLTGQVMKISGGKADPKVVGKLIEEKLAKLSQDL